MSKLIEIAEAGEKEFEKLFKYEDAYGSCTVNKYDITTTVTSRILAVVEGILKEIESLNTPLQNTKKENFGLIDYGFQMSRNHTINTLTEFKNYLKK